MENKITHEGFFCSRCNYISKRKYNLERHMRLMHKPEENDDFMGTQNCAENVKVAAENVKVAAENVKVVAENVKVVAENVKVGGANVYVHEQNENGEYKCPNCYKTYTRKYNINKHIEKCKNMINPLECEKCKGIYSSRSSLSQHRKICQGLSSSTALVCAEGASLASTSIQTQNNTTIQTQNNTTIQNQTQNNTTNIQNNTTQNNTTNNIVNVLAFPSEDDQSFDFVTDRITKSVMKKIAKSWRPAIGFNKFIGAIFEDPRNRCIRKKGPNVSHSEIHTGNNQWELALDIDVFPVLTHHLTTAALSKIIEFKESMKLIINNFHHYVDLLNTDNESQEYLDATQRMKLMIINLSRKWAAEEGITLS